MSRRLRRLRALVALLLLVFTSGYSLLEPASGLAREGEVHHLAATAARVHLHAATAALGGEQAPDVPHNPGPGHQHGGVTDHCTHQHAATLPEPPGLGVVLALAQVAFPEPESHPGQAARHLFRPPRA